MLATFTLTLISIRPGLGQRGGAMVRLDLLCPRTSLPRLALQLERDAITLVDIDSSSAGPAIVRVSLSPRRFRALFSPVLVTRSVARSADHGFYDQQHLERYVIPARYRGLIAGIRLPDPQIE
ncbi:MAG TPA: hypothetical protein VMF29_00790 [Candidatus Edwardsbacteria bacterium]|nr:hypothetical protein [Candidatus Edwardsbacteria bacterium]